MKTNTSKIPFKLVIMLRRELNFTWKSSEVQSLVIKENLQYAMISKFIWKVEHQRIEKSHSRAMRDKKRMHDWCFGYKTYSN